MSHNIRISEWNTVIIIYVFKCAAKKKGWLPLIPVYEVLDIYSDIYVYIVI